MDKKLEVLSDIKNELIDIIKCELAKGYEALDAEEAGKVTDMIKDLSEAEEKCMKACFYKKIVEEMKEEEQEDKRYGYNTRRYSNGQYAPSGRGHVGYNPMHGPYMHMMDEDAMLVSERMGYTKSGDGNRSQSGKNVSVGSYGYPENMGDLRYSKSFNEYRDAKRNYTKTHSQEDKQRMEEHANEHLVESMETLRDIWKNSDNELKQRMKNDLTNLVHEMN